MLRMIKFNDITKYDNYYESRYNIPCIRWYGGDRVSKDDFLKLYRDYTGNKFPIFTKTKHNDRKFITEKPIEDIMEELKMSLEKMRKYTKDKRIRDSLEVINDIALFLHEGYIVVKEVPFEDISKEYMDGGDIEISLEDYLTPIYNSYTLNLFKKLMGDMISPFSLNS